MSRLFIVSTATGYGGAERSVETILRHMPPGIATTVYAAHPEHLRQLKAIRTPASRFDLVRLSASPSPTARRMAALRLLADFLRLEPEIVIVNTHASAFLAAMVARYAPDFAGRCRVFVRDFLWSDLDYIFSRLSGARICVPHPVVAGRIGYLRPYHLSGEADYDVVPDLTEIPQGTPTYAGPILHLATVNPFKGHADLMLALDALKTGHPGIEMLSAGAIGNADLQRRLGALRDRLGIDRQFTFAGYVPDPAPLLETCRAVVMPSVSHSGGPETFGRAVIEAWAHGKPVIAYATGAPAALIDHETDGLLVPEGDTQALADALLRLWTDEGLCRRLGEAGHKKFLRHYEAGRMTRPLLERLGLRTG